MGWCFAEFDDLTSRAGWRKPWASCKARVWRAVAPVFGRLPPSPRGWDTTARSGLQTVGHPPAAYPESPCCRAPFLPLLTRDVRETGLICQHCDDTLVPFEEFPADLQTDLGKWAAQYADVHGVAHWDERQRRSCGDYDRAYDEAAKQAERLLGQMGALWAPRLLELYPAVVWEDHDECLDVRPEDVDW